MQENSPQSIHFAKNFLGGGGACPQTTLAWAAYTAAAYGSHVGFTHKLGNPLPQILDPPLNSIPYGEDNLAMILFFSRALDHMQCDQIHSGNMFWMCMYTQLLPSFQNIHQRCTMFHTWDNVLCDVTRSTAICKVLLKAIKGSWK